MKSPFAISSTNSFEPMKIQNLLQAQNKNWGIPPIKPDPNEFTAYSAYYKAAQNRIASPGLAENAFVVSRYNNFKLKEQYVYGSIYDAIREVLSIKECETEGSISLSIYTDAYGMEPIRNWEYEYEGYTNINGDTIECEGWVRV